MGDPTRCDTILVGEENRDKIIPRTRSIFELCYSYYLKSQRRVLITLGKGRIEFKERHEKGEETTEWKS